LKAKGVVLAFITLHVGPGTFIPVRTERIEDHRMLAEEFNIPDEAAVTINHALDEGRRIVAIGTTTARVLEHIIVQKGRMIPGWGSSDLFIIPGFTFRCVSALLTNFHLPCSTLFMLATAFGGYDLIRAAYREAIKKKYRFFSYGDAMLIL
jgi:S-adenosylmethionine:tRNA ribosyltransferase-isomerase